MGGVLGRFGLRFLVLTAHVDGFAGRLLCLVDLGWWLLLGLLYLWLLRGLVVLVFGFAGLALPGCVWFEGFVQYV